MQQAVGSFLQPPAWRSTRFLNLESHLGWANDMLALLCGGVEGTLAEQLGRSEAETKQWLEEKLGWLRGYAGEVRVWSYFQRVVKDAEEEIKRAGLSRTSWRRIKRRLIGESKLIGKERAFRRQVLAFVQKEGAKVPVRQRYLGSTDVAVHQCSYAYCTLHRARHGDRYVAVRRSHGSCCMEACAKSVDDHQW